MDGLIDVMRKKGETIPENDPPEAVSRFNRLAHTLQGDGEAEPIFEQLSATSDERV